MPVHVEERPRTTNAERYHSWSQSSAAVLDFVKEEQVASPQPLFLRGNDPTDSTVTAMLYHVHMQWYVPVRNGDWVVEGGQGEFIVQNNAEFEKQWKVPQLGLL